MDLSRIYGVRLLYRERDRPFLAIALAVMSALVYAARSFDQFVNLDVSTDFLLYRGAAAAIRAGHSPYAPFVHDCLRPGGCWGHGGYYIYPPPVALMTTPLLGLSVAEGARVWLVADHVTLLACILIAYRTVGPHLSGAAKALLLSGALLFLPLYENLYFMQVNVFLLFLLVLTALAFVRRGAGIAAGAGVAAGALFRVTPAGLAFLLIPRRDGVSRASGLVGLVAAGLAGLGLLTLATGSTVEYLVRVLPGLSAGGGWIESVSLPAALARAGLLLGGSMPPAVAVVTPLLSLLVLGITWYRGTGLDGRVNRAAVFGTLLAAIPIASTVTEQHHLVAELLVLALLAPSLVPGTRPWWFALAAYPLLWISHDDPYHWAAALPAGSLQDHVNALLMIVPVNLVGMILLWFAGLEVLRRTHGAQESAAAP